MADVNIATLSNAENELLEDLEQNTGIEAEKLRDAIEVTKQLGNALNQKTSDFGKILGTLKEVSGQAQFVFTDIKGSIADKNVSRIVKRTEKLNKILDKDSVSGHTVKKVLELVAGITKSVVSIIIGISSGNFGLIAESSVQILLQLKNSFDLMSLGFKKMKKFYLEVIKPKIDKVVIKIEKGFKEVKGKMDDIFGKKHDSHHDKAHYSDSELKAIKEDILKMVMAKSIDLDFDKNNDDEDMIYAMEDFNDGVIEDYSEVDVELEDEIEHSVLPYGYEDHEEVLEDDDFTDHSMKWYEDDWSDVFEWLFADADSFWIEMEDAINAIGAEIDELELDSNGDEEDSEALVEEIVEDYDSVLVDIDLLDELEAA